MQARAISFHTVTVAENQPIVVDTNQEVLRVEVITIPGTFSNEDGDFVPSRPGVRVTIITSTNEPLVRLADGQLVTRAQALALGEAGEGVDA